MKHGSRQRHLESLKRETESLKREKEELTRQLADARSRVTGLQRTVTTLLDRYASHIDGILIVSGQIVGTIQTKAMPAWEGQKD